MPISGGKYVAPTWRNNAAPAIDAAELQAMSDTLAALQTPGANAKLQFVAKYVTAGSYNWISQKTADYLAVIIGGGGGGARGLNSQRVTGGASGFVSFYLGQISENTSIPVVVGNGGAGTSVNGSGSDGGSSSFAGVVAEGGEGGETRNPTPPPASGGQPSSGRYPQSNRDIPPFNGVTIVDGDGGMYVPCTQVSMFLDERGLPISMLCAGGNSGETESATLPNGKTMSPGVNGDGLSPITPTDCGAGGGVAYTTEGSAGTSASGAPGGVFIYRIMGGAA